MFGTTLTVIDGYSRSNVESLRILLKKKGTRASYLNIAFVAASVSGALIIFFFNNALGPMLKFAMIASFVTTPVFCYFEFVIGIKRVNTK